MTREEAIKRLEWLEMVAEYVDSVTIGSKCTEDWDAYNMAIAALREQEQEDPKPLTLDELRKMDREPVWLTGVEPEDTWARIDHVETLTIGFSLFGDSETWRFWTKCYGEIVFAYRHKPKEEV